MIRGTFANIRSKMSSFRVAKARDEAHAIGDILSIFDAAARYAGGNVPLVIIGGSEYGAGSSRDWAAKVRACWAFER
jgi:aconitate hydratase